MEKLDFGWKSWKSSTSLVVRHARAFQNSLKYNFDLVWTQYGQFEFWGVPEKWRIHSAIILWNSRRLLQTRIRPWLSGILERFLGRGVPSACFTMLYPSHRTLNASRTGSKGGVTQHPMSASGLSVGTNQRAGELRKVEVLILRKVYVTDRI